MMAILGFVVATIALIVALVLAVGWALGLLDWDN